MTNKLASSKRRKVRQRWFKIIYEHRKGCKSELVMEKGGIGVMALSLQWQHLLVSLTYTNLNWLMKFNLSETPYVQKDHIKTIWCYFYNNSNKFILIIKFVTVFY